MAKKMKSYRVSVYFVNEVDVTVKARNAREAWGKAAKRVKARKVGNCLRRDFSTIEDNESGNVY